MINNKPKTKSISGKLIENKQTTNNMQKRILDALKDEPYQTQAELVKATGIHKSDISKELKILRITLPRKIRVNKRIVKIEEFVRKLIEHTKTDSYPGLGFITVDGRVYITKPQKIVCQTKFGSTWACEQMQIESSS